MKKLILTLLILPIIFYSCAPLKSDIIYKRGNRKMDNAQYEKALKIFQKGTLLQSDSKYHFHWLKAFCYYKLKDYQSTLDEISNALIGRDKFEKSELSELYYLKGYAEGGLGKKTLEIESYMKSISLNPKNTGSHVSLGFCLNELEKYDLALKVLNTALELNPENAYAFNNRARSKIGLSEFTEAEEDLKKALSFDPKNPYIYLNKYELYKAQNQIVKACEMIKIAQEFDAERPKFDGLTEELKSIFESDCAN